jgi:uncharacterized protein (DUF924 family)
MDPREIVDLWLSERVRPLWFNSTPDFDRELRGRFEALWTQARDGLLAPWEDAPLGALALIILLDQLPLNMYRGRPESFSTEAAARAVAGRAIAAGRDRAVPTAARAFFYLPYMHSEDPADQDRSVALYRDAGLTDGLRWAEHHREIVRRFGRFPHRNAILGRPSTSEELAWLASPEAFQG